MSLEERFEIEPPIHVGQVATSYPAVQKGLQRRVLLKVLHPHFAGDAELTARFQREGQAVARIDHPNVVRVYECGREDGVWYLALEWVEGGTLAERLEEGPLSSGEVLQLARDILAGLAAVHGQGLVHRDLKPDNILVDRQGRARLADFSLAGFSRGAPGLTAHGAVVGTPAYMAPELAEGAPASAHSDLFGLGLILLEALTGSNPYAAPEPLVSLDLLRRREPPRLGGRPGVDPTLAQLVDALLQRDPARRPENAAAALQLLDGVEPVAARRPPLKGAAWVAVALPIAAALIWFWLQRQQRPAALQSPPDTAAVAVQQPAVAGGAEADTLPVRATEVPDTAPQAKLLRQVAHRTPQVVEPVAVRPARLSVVAAPWAEVWLDDTLLGTTPLGTREIEPGRHRLTFRHPVYPPVARYVDLTAGGADTVVVNLQGEAGSVALTAAPWGYLWVDGDSIGLLPRMEPVWLKPGGHILEVRNPQYPPWRDSLTVAAGDRLEVRVDLKSGTEIAP